MKRGGKDTGRTSWKGNVITWKNIRKFIRGTREFVCVNEITTLTVTKYLKRRFNVTPFYTQKQINQISFSVLRVSSRLSVCRQRCCRTVISRVRFPMRVTLWNPFESFLCSLSFSDTLSVHLTRTHRKTSLFHPITNVTHLTVKPL